MHDAQLAPIPSDFQAIQWAISDGVDVFGYCPWSALDLVSTHPRIARHCGFIHVNGDEHDLRGRARTKKDSFHRDRAIIDSNGTHLTPHRPTPPTGTENPT